MQKIDCNQYPLIGKLLSKALEDDKKIHRSPLFVGPKGRVTIYYEDGQFILECDTTGDHLPNEYYFFQDIERNEAYQLISAMAKNLGEKRHFEFERMTDDAMNFLKMRF